jgi:hypothetical protein
MSMVMVRAGPAREPRAGVPRRGQQGGSDHDGVPSRCVSLGRQAEAAISVAKLR